MNRLQASGTHLAISAGVVAIFFSIVYFIWYPAPYFTIEGTFDVIVILIGVDVVLGPLLTLVVFKPNKPSLKFDLSVIALVQISALLYGANTIYSERPYFIAFAVDRFTVIHANQVKEMDLSTIVPTLNYQHLGPTYVYAEIPSDPQEKSKILEESMSGGADIDAHPELYRDLKKNFAKSFHKNIDLDTLAIQSSRDKVIINRFRARNPDTQSLVFYPLMGKSRDVILVLNKDNAEVVDYIDINPWNSRKKHVPQPLDNKD